MYNSAAKLICERFEKAKSDRSPIDPILQEISDYQLIHKGNFTRDSTIQTLENVKVYDSTAIEASKRSGANIHGGLTTSKWFAIQVPGYDLNEFSVRARHYLENATDIMLAIYNGSFSGFTTSNFEYIMSQITLGTGCMYREYDYTCKTLRYASIHLSQIYILENKWGDIDTVFRCYKMTIRQAAQAFGLKKLPERWQRYYEKEPDRKVEIVHCVKPRDELSTKKYSGFRFDSVYVDLESKTILEEKGMYNMPYNVCRFDKRAGDIYGIGPGWDCVPEVRMLNQQRKDFLRANQLQSMPPLLLSDDAVMQNLPIIPFGKINSGVDPVTGQPRVIPLKVGAELQSSLASMEMSRQTIKEMYYVDQMYFKDGTPLSATEVMQRQEARSQTMSPAIDRMKIEGYGKLIRDDFDTLQREGHFGPVPEELDLKELKVEYLSPLARLNKMQDVLALQRALASLAPFAPMAPELFAQLLDPIKFQETVIYSCHAAGFPASLIKTKPELDEMEAEKQQQANMQQNLQLAGFAQQLNQKVQ